MTNLKIKLVGTLITENISNRMMQQIKKYYQKLAKDETISTDEMDSQMTKYLQQLFVGKNSELQDIIPALITSMSQNGADANKNEFLGFIARFPNNQLFKNNGDKFEYLNDLYDNNLVSLKNDGVSTRIGNRRIVFPYYVANLYEQKSFEDFRYIVNAFALLTNKQYVADNFDEDFNIDLTQFFNKDKLKSRKEIEQIISDWYDEFGKTAKTFEKTSRKTLTDVLHKKLGKYASQADQREYLRELLKKFQDKISSEAVGKEV